MPTAVLSSREFNQDMGCAKRAADSGPVFITDHGHATHALLAIDDCRRMTGSVGKIADLLALPGVEDIPFDPPRSSDLARPANLS